MSAHKQVLFKLFVFNQKKLVGLVSIGDVVKEILEEQAQTIEQLKSYIAN